MVNTNSSYCREFCIQDRNGQKTMSDVLTMTKPSIRSEIINPSNANSSYAYRQEYHRKASTMSLNTGIPVEVVKALGCDKLRVKHFEKCARHYRFASTTLDFNDSLDFLVNLEREFKCWFGAKSLTMRGVEACYQYLVAEY